VFVELRTYSFHPGKLPEFMRLYEQEGLEVQKRVLGNMVGYFTTDIGMLNQVVHLWGYEDLKQRQERRERLAADKTWQTYLAKVLPLIQTMESKILVPASFSPVHQERSAPW
jgi:hypothetical protein